jgi:hypothetical protein
MEYKEKAEYEVNPNQCIAHMVSYVGGLRFAHWQANTVTNEHKALGDLYDALSDLIDTFTEVFIGKYGMVKFIKGVELVNVSVKPCAKGLTIVESLQKNFDAGDDDDLLNIIADMSTALNKAKYLLKENIGE